MKKNKICINIIVAKTNEQINFYMEIEEHTNISYIISYCNNILNKYVDVNNIQFGVFGITKELNYKVKNGDRIEIYRNLLLDPIIRRKNLLKKNS
jgi:putative ubiquitin-RnfH superfamily antitoxin RatB of RatAB toxin-antitoxin module